MKSGRNEEGHRVGIPSDQITIENCTFVNHSTEYSDTKWFRGTIYADAFYGDEEFDAGMPVRVNEMPPTVDGIFFKDITVDTIAGNAVYLCGLPEMPFKRKCIGKRQVRNKNRKY